MKRKLVLPREGLYRAVHAIPASPTYNIKAVRAPSGDETGNTLELQWSVFDRWTEIDSWFEGHFMERIAPGAFAKTIRENAANMRILLQHGRDPQLGQKPIASIDDVRENEIGGYAEGRLFDGLDPLVVDGLRAGQYGASFAFRVMRDELNQEPEPSEYNPKGIPERTIREAAVSEFGPVTWGAYSEASAGVRSLTDEMRFATLRDMPPERLVELARYWRDGQRLDAEDLGHIAQMMVCGTDYIADQDEADESGNVTVMEEVLTLLSTLVTVEAAEDEPAEPEDEGEYSAPDDASESRRGDGPVEAPANATPTTVKRSGTTPDYLTMRQRSPRWHLS